MSLRQIPVRLVRPVRSVAVQKFKEFKVNSLNFDNLAKLTGPDDYYDWVVKNTVILDNAGTGDIIYTYKILE